MPSKDKTILVASSNPGKIAELKAMLDALGIRVGKKSQR